MKDCIVLYSRGASSAQRPPFQEWSPLTCDQCGRRIQTFHLCGRRAFAEGVALHVPGGPWLPAKSRVKKAGGEVN